jgi:hypothetical protein
MQLCSHALRHDTESAVLIEVLAAGLDWNCFKVACLKLWARSDLGAVFNEAALLFVETQCFATRIGDRLSLRKVNSRNLEKRKDAPPAGTDHKEGTKRTKCPPFTNRKGWAALYRCFSAILLGFVGLVVRLNKSPLK